MHAAIVAIRPNRPQALRCLSVVIGFPGRRPAGDERLDSSFRLLASINGQTGHSIGIASNERTNHGYGEDTRPDPASLTHIAPLHPLGFARASRPIVAVTQSMAPDRFPLALIRIANRFSSRTPKKCSARDSKTMSAFCAYRCAARRRLKFQFARVVVIVTSSRRAVRRALRR